MSESEAKSFDVAITFSIEAKINQSRSIVAQTAVPRDAEVGEINAVLDKVAGALDRQEAKALLKGLKVTLERDRKQFDRQVDQVAKLRQTYESEWAAQNRRGPYELRGQQKSNIENQEASLTALDERIKTIERDIEELGKVAA